jgi:alpha-tubulin suppressor-like RCC1 family protein
VTAIPTPKTTPAPGNALHIAAGQAHTCVIAGGGLVKCWGQNDRGELGDGTSNQSNVPVSVALPAPALAIGAGAKHTCAVVQSSGLMCWGNNNRGQLGDGTKTNRNTPVSVLNLGANVVEVTGGVEHTCALLAAGSVWCWGRNDAGQLGTGTKSDSLLPVPALLTGTATAIAAGDKYTCAAVTGVGVECWGQNSKGQLGDGTKADHSLPTLASGTGGLPVRSLAAGQSHTCASFTDGSLMCWGNNGNGQLGNGTTVDSLTPALAFATGVQAVTAGHDFTCVTTLSVDVQCWGNNAQGQLGDGSSHGDSAVPTLVNPLPGDVLEIRSGQGHTCSLHISGAVYCWGQNNRGQLGNGGNTGSGIPVQVSGFLSSHQPERLENNLRPWLVAVTAPSGEPCQQRRTPRLDMSRKRASLGARARPPVDTRHEKSRV